VTLTEAQTWHTGCTRVQQRGTGRHDNHGNAGRKPKFVPCPHCGASVNRTEARKGHAGCTRVKRKLPPRRVKRPRREEIAAALVREEVHGDLILPLTREQISERIDRMSTGAFGRMAARLLLKRRPGGRELRRAG